MLAPIFRGSGRRFERPSSNNGTRKASRNGSKTDPAQTDYSKLSEYEIEDIEYEEIKKEKESH
jgi:hypothetical protein